MDEFADFVEEARAFKKSAGNDNDQDQAAEWLECERKSSLCSKVRVCAEAFLTLLIRDIADMLLFFVKTPLSWRNVRIQRDDVSYHPGAKKSALLVFCLEGVDPSTVYPFRVGPGAVEAAPKTH